MRKIIKTIFALVLSVFVVSAFSVKAANDLVVPIDGASIRTADGEIQQGLRFYAKLDESVKNNDHGFYLVFGETTVANLQAAIAAAVDDEVFINGKIVFKVPVSGINQDNEYSVVLTGIPEIGYVDELSAIPYVMQGGAEKLPEAPVKRSVLEVAAKAVENGESSPSLTSILNYAQANTKIVRMTESGFVISAFDSSATGDYTVYNVGDKVALPAITQKAGYEFLHYKNNNVEFDPGDLVTIGAANESYNLIYSALVYSITYNNSWLDKAEFVESFYSDFYAWLLTRDGKDAVIVTGSQVKMTLNGYTVTVSNVDDFKDIGVDPFERTFGTLIYKPFNRVDDNPVIPVADENYFLNSDAYRKKYEQLDGYFLNCVLEGYPHYDTGYNPASLGRVQIFYRFHQWATTTTPIPTLNLIPFDYIYSGGQPETYTVESNTINLTQGSIGRTGYSFDGWYDQKTGGNKVASILKGSLGDKDLYARWAINQYTITFNSNGGSAVAALTANYKSTISAPTAPTKTDYLFAGWFVDQALKNEYEFETMPAENFTLYAKWVEAAAELNVSSADVAVLNQLTPDVIVSPSAVNGAFYVLKGTGLSGNYNSLEIPAYSSISAALSYLDTTVTNKKVYIVGGTYSDTLDIKAAGTTLYGPNYNVHGHATRVAEAHITGLTEILAANVNINGLRFSSGGAIKVGANYATISHIYTNATQVVANGVNRRGCIVDSAVMKGLTVKNSWIKAPGSSQSYTTQYMSFSTANDLTVEDNYIENVATTLSDSFEGMMIYNPVGTINIKNNEFHFATTGYIFIIGYYSNTGVKVNIIDNIFAGRESHPSATIQLKNGKSATYVIRGNQFINFHPATYNFSGADSNSTATITYNYYDNQQDYRVSVMGSVNLTLGYNCYKGPIAANDVSGAASETTSFSSLEALQAAYAVAYP